jgi:hypothetical protein
VSKKHVWSIEQQRIMAERRRERAAKKAVPWVCPKCAEKHPKGLPCGFKSWRQRWDFLKGAAAAKKAF